MALSYFLCDTTCYLVCVCVGAKFIYLFSANRHYSHDSSITKGVLHEFNEFIKNL